MDPRRQKYFIEKGCLSIVIPFIFFVLYFLINLKDWDVLKESQILASLQSQGVIAQACIIEKVDLGFRTAPNIVYSFQTPLGIWTERVKVSRDYFASSNIGDCFNIFYLPQQHTISRPEVTVNNFDITDYWIVYLISIIPMIMFAVLCILAYLTTLYFIYIFRRRNDRPLG